MRPLFLFRIAIVLLLLAILAACQYLREPNPAAPPVASPNPAFPVVHLTADEAAQAMEQDRFFSTYGQSTLLIQGTVSATRRQDADLFVTLGTTVPTKVICDLPNYLGIVRVGDTVTVQAAYPQRDASRQGSTVMIKNCAIP